MKEDSLFSGDIPLSINNPHSLLDSLHAQLLNPSLHTICNNRPNGLSLLDDGKWVGLEGEIKEEVAMETQSEDHVTFDDDFLSADLLSSVLQNAHKTITTDHTPEKPVLRVNDDHSYGQFITQTNTFDSNHTHPLIAESPTHLLVPEYPLITPNPTHLMSAPTNNPLIQQNVSSAITTPTLPPLSFSVLPQQQEVTPLTPSFVTLSSPSPSPTLTNLTPSLQESTSAQKTTPIFNTLLPQKATPIQEVPPTSQKVKKRRKSSKDSAKPLRKVRCGQCMECLQEPCGVCKFCLDSPKFGGTGKLRKACVHRRCSNVSMCAYNNILVTCSTVYCMYASVHTLYIYTSK